MVAWSIRSAIQSGYFDQVTVSTDDPQIAEISQQYGATTLFVRPAQLSHNYTPATPVVIHALRWLSAHGKEPDDHTYCIYATNPFLEPNDTQLGLQKLQDSGCEFFLPITSFPPIQQALKSEATGRITMADSNSFPLDPKISLGAFTTQDNSPGAQPKPGSRETRISG